MSVSGSSKHSEVCPSSARRIHLCGRVSIHVKILWSTLSMMVTAGCAFSFTQPFWFIQPQTKDCLGLYNYCIRDMRTRAIAAFARSAVNHQTTGPLQICAVHGGHFHLSHLPSNAWQIACVLYGGGCVLLILGCFASLVTFCLPNVWSTRLACYTGYIQTMAAVILIAAIFTFPLGLDSKFARHYCPGARMYNGGTCHVGWAYILGVMATALSIFCPFLSQYTDFYEDLATPLIA